MEKVMSPCISVCQYDSKDVCFGCRRTKDEIGKWSFYTNEEKAQVIKNTGERRNVPGEQPTKFLR